MGDEDKKVSHADQKGTRSLRGTLRSTKPETLRGRDVYQSKALKKEKEK